MKGQDVPLWTYLVLAVTLILVSVFASPFYESLEFTKNNNARLEAQNIAGVINMIKSSTSDNFYYKKPLPKACTIEITDLMVNVSVTSGQQENSYVSNVIQTPVKVEPATINCDKQRSLQFTKTGNSIGVS
jgi:hypothetical protein